MRVQAPIANTIDITDSMIQYDSACKKLLAHKVILAWILKSVVSEFRTLSIHLNLYESFTEGRKYYHPILY